MTDEAVTLTYRVIIKGNNFTLMQLVTDDLHRHVVRKNFFSNQAQNIGKVKLQNADGMCRNCRDKLTQALCIRFQQFTLSTSRNLKNAKKFCQVKCFTASDSQTVYCNHSVTSMAHLYKINYHITKENNPTIKNTF